MEKNAADMTVEEFAEHLKMMNDRVKNFKSHFSVVDKRLDPRSTRSYANAKRGNFQGSSQKEARKNLEMLNISVRSDNNLRKGKYDG